MMINGRIMLKRELPITYYSKRLIRGKGLVFFYFVFTKKALILTENKLYCQRCHTIFLKEEGALAKDNYWYCPYCVTYGRITNKDKICFQPYHASIHHSYPLLWDGELSKYQQKISDALVSSIHQSHELLVYAVTGAGKTEVIYRYLEELVNRGEKIAYVAPRIDVVLEIANRLQKVFPTMNIPILYQNNHQYWDAPITASTIQQLIHFYRCFDVIIIDEVDAFPYQGNDFLKRLVSFALKENGQLLYLTATLTADLEKKKEKIPCFTLPIRYHLQPLPVPKYHFCLDFKRWLFQKYPPKIVNQKIKRQQRPILIFMPNIERMHQLEIQFKHWYPSLNICSVYSEDLQRENKILKMRQKPYDLLLTTTILERGVTFIGIDVWIIEAHHPSFTKQSLVQISGRVARKKEALEGEVCWFATGWTQSMKDAYHMILQMNNERKKLLYEM